VLITVNIIGIYWYIIEGLTYMLKNKKYLAGGLIPLLMLSLGATGFVIAKNKGWDYQKLKGVLKPKKVLSIHT